LSHLTNHADRVPVQGYDHFSDENESSSSDPRLPTRSTHKRRRLGEKNVSTPKHLRIIEWHPPSSARIQALSTTPPSSPTAHETVDVQQTLSPVLRQDTQGCRYFVLSAPGAKPTDEDLILPNPDAFGVGTDDEYTSMSFKLESQGRDIDSILKDIKHPRRLWDVYQPPRITKLSSVQDVWHIWSKGQLIPNVGRKPPVRCIEEGRWGKPRAKVGDRSVQAAWRKGLSEKVVNSKV
jgi:hypothetical protein